MTTTAAPAAITFEAITKREPRDGKVDIVVSAIVHGVQLDHSETHGYVVTTPALAKRLAAAIEAGAVFHDFEVRTDVNGKTFLGYSSRVLGRMMNADLRRLGF